MKVQDKNDPKFLNKRVCHRPSLSITGPSIFQICFVQVIVVKYFHLNAITLHITNILQSMPSTFILCCCYCSLS